MSTDIKTPAQVKAAEAGARGKSTTPLTAHERADNYQRQNALSGRKELTDRQYRQIDRMDDRAFFRRRRAEYAAAARRARSAS